LYKNLISKRGIRKYYIKTGPSYEVITDVSLEVLRGQRIKLINAVSNSEFHEY
jgi:hypothetical protein